MTDYRDINTPGLHSTHHYGHRRPQSQSGAMGGVLIALALIGLVLLALSIFFTDSTGNQAVAPTSGLTDIQPAPPANDETKPLPAE